MSSFKLPISCGFGQCLASCAESLPPGGGVCQLQTPLALAFGWQPSGEGTVTEEGYRDSPLNVICSVIACFSSLGI